MAMAYPATLPAPLLEGHAISAGQDTIRTDMETGAARQRRRSFSSPDRVNLAWVFSSAQFAVFRAWYDGEINGGGAWFTLPIDDGVLGYATPRDVRFVESFEASKLGSQMWRISVKAEIRRQRLSAFDHLNLLGLPSLDLDFAGTKSLSPVITSARQPTPSITFTRASTATYVDADGLIKTAAINAPRFDHDPVSLACKGLLIQEARTNLLLWNADLGNAAWSKSGATVTNNAAVSPDGTQTADALIENTASATNHAVSQSAPITAGQSLAFSVYVKPASGVRHLRIQCSSDSGVNGFRAYFDLQSFVVAVAASGFGTGSAITGSAKIEACQNGWYRLVVAGSVAPSAASVWVDIFMQAAPTGSASYSGDGSSGLYLWGAQLEVGSFPTSYIPTTTAAVTRSADSAVMTGANFSSWYRSDELTVFVDRISPAYSVVAAYDAVRLHDGTANNDFSLRVVGGGTQSLDSWVRSSGATQVDSSNPACAANLVHKHAAAIKDSDFADSINGAAVFSDSSVTVPALNQMVIGASGAGWFRKIQAYPKRLSNAKLQAMTV